MRYSNEIEGSWFDWGRWYIKPLHFGCLSAHLMRLRHGYRQCCLRERCSRVEGLLESLVRMDRQRRQRTRGGGGARGQAELLGDELVARVRADQVVPRVYLLHVEQRDRHGDCGRQPWLEKLRDRGALRRRDEPSKVL